jgi:caa(3)-type oxidase subunit IV
MLATQSNQAHSWTDTELPAPELSSKSSGIRPAKARAEAPQALEAPSVPLRALAAVLITLLLLTAATVALAKIDLGSGVNLTLALGIAGLKALLIAAFFMHLIWDKRMHLVLLGVALLFAALFVVASAQDRREYQPELDAFETAHAPLQSAASQGLRST